MTTQRQDGGDSYAVHVTNGLIDLQLLKFLGLRAIETGEDGRVALELTNETALLNPFGVVLGAALLALTDVTASLSAVFAWRQRGIVGSAFATQDLTFQFLSPARQLPVRAFARPLRVSRQRAVIDVRVTDAEDAEQPVGVGLVSVRCLAAQN
jgi:uncharacterized protein (TIGR00369 family)